MKDKRPEPEEVTRIRNLLKAWDDNLLTASEFEMMLTQDFKDELFTLLRNNCPYGECRAGISNEKALPAVTIDVELEIFPGGFWMRPKK